MLSDVDSHEMLVNWNYSTNVFCSCNSANWLFIIFACDWCFQYRENSFFLYSFASECQPCKQGCIGYWNMHRKMLERQIHTFQLPKKTYPWNHLWPLILSKQLFKPSLEPWQWQSYAGCSSWETLPPWDNRHASVALLLGENENSRTKNSVCFTALEPFNMLCFASSIAAWIQDSTYTLRELWPCWML